MSDKLNSEEVSSITEEYQTSIEEFINEPLEIKTGGKCKIIVKSNTIEISI